MKLRSKLVLPTWALAAVLAAALACALRESSRQARALERGAQRVQAVTSLSLALREAVREEERSMAALRVGGGAGQERRLLRAGAEIARLMASIDSLAAAPRERRLWRDLAEARAALEVHRRELLASVARGDGAAAAVALDQWRILAGRADAALADLSAYHLRALDRAVLALAGRNETVLRAVTPTLSVGIALAVLAALLVSRAVVQRIVDTSRAAEEIAETGRLSPVRGADRADEIGLLAGSFNRMTERLVTANARLAEADRRKDEFLGMLSHELRNPLAPIRSSIALLLRLPMEDARGQRAVAVLDRQSAHLTRLVDDLLDVTRIARGKIRVERARVDLAAVVRGAVEDFTPLARERGIELRAELPAAPLWVDGDATRLAQVAANLLQNAVKFTPAGAISVALRAGPGLAELRVRDTGVGMSPELMAHVFEPFVQADRSLARTDGGLGLGLALVKGLVELHGGGVQATSDGPGAGAELIVRLPARAPELPDPPPGARAGDAWPWPGVAAR